MDASLPFKGRDDVKVRACHSFSPHCFGNLRVLGVFQGCEGICVCWGWGESMYLIRTCFY